jgi:hypothetical protein
MRPILAPEDPDLRMEAAIPNGNWREVVFPTNANCSILTESHFHSHSVGAVGVVACPPRDLTDRIAAYRKYRDYVYLSAKIAGLSFGFLSKTAFMRCNRTAVWMS